MMKKVIPFVVLALIIVSVGIVAAQGGLQGSGWKSGQQIQNIGNGQASVVFVAYDKQGNATQCGPAETLDPGESYNVLTDVDCAVAAGFQGSAVVSADQPIAAITNVTNRGVGPASGQYQGTDGADVDTSISFPLVKENHVGRTTTFYVQNASTSSNDIDVEFVVNGITYPHSYPNVPGNAMVVVMPSDAGVPGGNGQVGSLSVTGTQPLAGAALEHEASAAVGTNLQASKAFAPAEASDELYCPLYRNAHTAKGQTTGLQVQNVGPAAVDVDMEFDGNTYSANVASGASHTFYAPALVPAIPAGTFGAATVTGPAGSELVAVVNDAGTDSGLERKTTYSCFPGGTQTVYVPLFKEDFGGNSSGIQVQNVGSGPTKFTLNFLANNGATLEIESTNSIGVGDSLTAFGVSAPSADWQVLNSSGNMVNTFSGVVVTASDDIVAIANESSLGATPSGQDTKNYEGFND